MAKSLEQEADSTYFQEIADALEQDLKTWLWQPDSGYFATRKEMPNLSSTGNLLAVVWCIADNDEANMILNAMLAAHMADPVPTKAAHSPYKKSDIAIENHLGGMANYHTDGAWLWIGAWHIVALCQMDWRGQARQLLNRMANIIVRDQQIKEVYGPEREELSNFWYTSESPSPGTPRWLSMPYKKSKLACEKLHPPPPNRKFYCTLPSSPTPIYQSLTASFVL